MPLLAGGSAVSGLSGLAEEEEEEGGAMRRLGLVGVASGAVPGGGTALYEGDGVGRRTPESVKNRGCKSVDVCNITSLEDIYTVCGCKLSLVVHTVQILL